MGLRVLLMAAVIALAAEGAMAKSRAPIRFADGETAAQKVVIAISMQALKKAGFKSQVVPVDRASLLSALGNGTVHAHPAVIGANHTGLAAAIDAKMVRSLGGLAKNDPDGAILKLIWPGMKSKWPDAQKLLKRMIISEADRRVMADAVAAGQSPDEVALAWWTANRRIWKPWIAASKNWMKP